MGDMSRALPPSRDDRWSALLLAILASTLIAGLVWIARTFPSPPDWNVQHSERFELRAGMSGSWSPSFRAEHAEFPCRRLRVVSDGDFLPVEPVGFRVLARVDPADAVCPERMREHGVDGWIPVGGGEEFQVDPPRVARIDFRVDMRPGVEAPDAERAVKLQIYGIEDSAIDLETPAVIGAILVALFVWIPSIAWYRRELSAVRARR